MTPTVDDEADEEITQYPCCQCQLAIAEADPFEFVIDGRPAHKECFERHRAGRPSSAPVSLCPEVHETFGACSMFAGHTGRHRNRGENGRLLAAWWKVAPF